MNDWLIIIIQALALVAISVGILSVAASAKSSASEAAIATTTALAFLSFISGVLAVLIHELQTLGYSAVHAMGLAVYFLAGGVAAAVFAIVCYLVGTQPVIESVVVGGFLVLAIMIVIVMIYKDKIVG
jgi:hypothetical protein